MGWEKDHNRSNLERDRFPQIMADLGPQQNAGVEPYDRQR